MEKVQKVFYGVSTVLILGVASEVVYHFWKKKYNESKGTKTNKKRQVPNDTKGNVTAVQSNSTLSSKKGNANDKCVKIVGYKDPDLWNTVLFFPDIMWDNPDSTTMKLFSYFRQATTTIHACIYQLSFHQMEKILIQKHKEGIRVKVITDYDPINMFNKKINPMLKAGIEMRHKKKNMGKDLHHKFAIIDEEAILTGSLNWSRQGVESNKENVMVTTNSKFVQQYLTEFNKLWDLFEVVDEAENCEKQ